MKTLFTAFPILFLLLLSASSFPIADKVTCQLTKAADHSQRLLDPKVTVMQTHPKQTDDLAVVTTSNSNPTSYEIVLGSPTTPTSQYLVYASAGSFMGFVRPSDCIGTNFVVYNRRQKDVLKFLLPDGVKANVTVFGGSGFGQQVFYQNFTFFTPLQTSSPTLQPSAPPTAAPTVTATTKSPTNQPIAAPPTGSPTVLVTSAPSVAPVVATDVPTMPNATDAPEYEEGYESNYTDEYSNETYEYLNETEYDEYDDNETYEGYEEPEHPGCEVSDAESVLFVLAMLNAKKCNNAKSCGGFTKLNEVYFWPQNGGENVTAADIFVECTVGDVINKYNATGVRYVECHEDRFALSNVCETKIGEMTVSQVLTAFGKVWCDFKTEHCLSNFVEFIANVGLDVHQVVAA